MDLSGRHFLKQKTYIYKYTDELQSIDFRWIQEVASLLYLWQWTDNKNLYFFLFEVIQTYFLWFTRMHLAKEQYQNSLEERSRLIP